MKADDPRLDSLAAAISDGIPVDWDTAESAATDAELRHVVRNLRAIANLASVHRTVDPDDSPAPPTRDDRSARRDANEALPRWGSYALLETLGHGSQGVVYRALDTRLHREVALKLRPRDSAAASILHEARLLARLRHPNIVTIFGADEFDGQTGIAMELVSGETLDKIVARLGAMNAGEAALIGMDLARAIGAVHQAGLLHRDVKAQNVMREAGGRYVLMDFGTGRELGTPDQTRAGTPLYLAPEVLSGAGASVQSEVYSLGVLLYHLVTGTFPVIASTMADLADAHLRGKRALLRHVRPDLPEAFVQAVDRTIAPNPGDRFANMGDLHAALSATLPVERVVTAARRVSPWHVAAIVAAIVAAGAIATRDWRSGGAATNIRTIAVLPFDDLSGSNADKLLGVGLADLLISELSERTSLRVIARTSTAAPEGRRQLSERAREFGIDALVEGSVRREADGLHASVRLVEAAGGSLMWSRSFVSSGSLTDIGERISALVTDGLNTELERRSAPARASPSAEALDAYFRGWAEYYGNLNRDGFTKAQDHFRETIRLAPDFAPAHAALAYVTAALAASFSVGALDAAFREATLHAEEASRLDPQNGYAEAVRGWIRVKAFDWNGGEAHYRRAVELNPSDASIHHLYAQFLMARNRLDAALIETKLAQQLDPLNETRRSQVALCYYYLRDYDKAIAESQQLLARNPGSDIAHIGLARFLSAAGRHADAITMLKTTPHNLSAAPVQAELARMLYVAGQPDEADSMMPSLQDAYRAGRLSPDYLAQVELARGRLEEGLALVTEAVRQRRPSAVWIHVDPRFDALRTDLRFRALEGELGLVDNYNPKEQ